VMKNRPWAQTQSDEPLLAKLGRRAYSAVIIIWGGGMYGTGDPHFMFWVIVLPLKERTATKNQAVTIEDMFLLD